MKVNKLDFNLRAVLASPFTWVMLLLILATQVCYHLVYAVVPEYAWLSLFAPAAALLIIWLLFQYPVQLFWAIVFLTPVSLNTITEQADVGLSFFNEPLIVLMAGGLMLYALYKAQFNKALLTHSISWGIYLYLSWLLLTCFTSTMPLVSFKFFASRIWYIGVFYFFGFYIFSEKKNIPRFFWLYTIPLIITVISTLYNHQQEGFERDASFYVMGPFFKDHGVYAATMAFMVPAVLMLAVKGRILQQRSLSRLLAFLFVTILITGILFSFTRAAWLSLAAATVMAIVFFLRVRMWMLLSVGAVAGLGYLMLQDELSVALSRNKQSSGGGSNFNQQVQSIGNISNDNSNLERINRWHSAMSMWKEKPLFGYGPGTYIFKYAPHQNSKDLTPISTNFGDGGNAHSEYLNPLAETGFPGLLTVLLLVILFTATGMKLIYFARLKNVRILAWAIVLGLITYYAHGFLNNYSDSDKTLVLIWAFAGMLTALDVKYGKKEILN
jgi:putative inorganic carbon (HCO3(-)) transporter